MHRAVVTITRPDNSFKCAVLERLWGRDRAGVLLSEGRWFDSPWSACQSVLEEDTEPQTAPDVLVGTLHGSHHHQYMNVCMNYCQSQETVQLSLQQRHQQQHHLQKLFVATLS